jgi:hypothetical protein
MTHQGTELGQVFIIVLESVLNKNTSISFAILGSKVKSTLCQGGCGNCIREGVIKKEQGSEIFDRILNDPTDKEALDIQIELALDEN